MALLQKWPSKKLSQKTAFFWLCGVITEKLYLSHKKSFVTLKDQYISYKLLFSLLLYHQYFSSYDLRLHLRLKYTWKLETCHIYLHCFKYSSGDISTGMCDHLRRRHQSWHPFLHLGGGGTMWIKNLVQGFNTAATGLRLELTTCWSQAERPTGCATPTVPITVIVCN